MHAGAGRGQPADKGRLLADRAHRRLVEIVNLPGQQSGDAAGKEQGQISRRIVCRWARQSVRRNVDKRRIRATPAQRIGVVLPIAKIPRLSLADDQIDWVESARSRIGGNDALPIIQIARERYRAVGIDADHFRPDIREQPPADGGGDTAAKLCRPEPRQQTHGKALSVMPPICLLTILSFPQRCRSPRRLDRCCR